MKCAQQALQTRLDQCLSEPTCARPPQHDVTHPRSDDPDATTYEVNAVLSAFEHVSSTPLEPRRTDAVDPTYDVPAPRRTASRLQRDFSVARRQGM